MQKKSLIDRINERIEKRKDINKLLKSKDYNTIYERYGQEEYKKAIPYYAKIREINSLFHQGRYLDIYERYGEKEYKKYLEKMAKVDVQNENGSKVKGAMEQIKYFLKINVAPILLALGILSSPAAMIESGRRSLQKQNEIEYSEELEEYNKYIKNYAKEIKSLNLTDIQIFVKVMYDLWNSIDGYKTPEKYDSIGTFRFSITEEKIGVCRNFSDHIVAELNEIDPRFEAQSLTVKMSPAEYNFIDIERNILEQDEPNNNNDDNNLIDEFLNENIIANHMIVICRLPSDGTIMALDPTNPGIGVVKNGKIYMFSSFDGTGTKARLIFNYLINGPGETMNYLLSSMETNFQGDTESIESLYEKYGPEALNEVLEYIQSLDKEKKNGDNKRDFVPKVEVDEKAAIERANNMSQDSTQDLTNDLTDDKQF